MNYSSDELINMIYCLNESHRNCLLASRIYRANYSGLYLRPEHFLKLKERFERTGSVYYEKTERVHEISNENSQINILTRVIENPNIRVRQISDEDKVSRSPINNIIKNRFSYHQAPTDRDYQVRLQFCYWALNKIDEPFDYF